MIDMEKHSSALPLLMTESLRHLMGPGSLPDYVQ